MRAGVKPRDLFVIQRAQAKYRGIEFYLSYDEWLNFWVTNLGPDWMNKRGKGRGQYVMSRKGDKGPYSVDNIVCRLSSDNGGKDRVTNGTVPRGEDHGCATVTNEQAIEIYKSPESVKVLKERYGVNGMVIRDIKRRKMWRHLTEDLPPAPYRSYNRLKPDEVIAIFKAKGTPTQISRRFNTPYATVYEIKCRRIWRSIIDGIDPQ